MSRAVLLARPDAQTSHRRLDPTMQFARQLAVIVLVAILAAVSAQYAQPAKAAAATQPVGWLHTSGSKILTASNQPHTIKAINWFGMETSNCAPHGLWKISLDEGLNQIAAFGFNTIRLPFSNQCLHAKTATSIDTSKNPMLANRTPMDIMDIVVARAAAHGLSIILDRHRPSSAAQSALWYVSGYSESAWIADWKMLASRYATSPTVIGADLHNEPRGAACWGCADASRNWSAAATRAGNAVLSANPRLLIIVEGVEIQGSGETTWWGGGLADVRARPMRLAVGGRLVYSTHEYPPSVAAQQWFSAAEYPANLDGQWDKTWGYLQKENIAPVLVGEFGTKLETRADEQWLDAFVSYLGGNNVSFAYWSFNPNSGDTGGLVKDDWVTPEASKLAALAPILG